MRKIKFFAFLVCILVLFNALPFVAFAQTQQDIVSEQKAELKKADVPELLSFEQARESGHTLRLHSKEESNTVAQNWRITSVDNGYRIANGSNPTYLLSTYNSSDSVYSMQKTTGSTWELRLIELPVPLYVQKDGAACGYACDTMVAHYFGCTSVTQTDMENKAKQLSADGNERYAYAICNALNYYLDINNTGVTYETSGMYLYNSSTYVSMLQNEINNGDPVIIQTKFVSSEYFKYNTMETGHYMVVIGMYFDTTENEYMCIINDSHDQYCDRRVVPASVVYSICVTHGGYVLKRAEEVS